MKKHMYGSASINALWLIAFILFPFSIYADVTGAQKLEVEHLLHYVESSSCEMYRNGDYHEGHEAASHILKKYDYFRDDITTTEEFIEYSATKSTMSGEYYMVKCGNDAAVKTKEWLLNELKRYRENKGA